MPTRCSLLTTIDMPPKSQGSFFLVALSSDLSFHLLLHALPLLRSLHRLFFWLTVLLNHPYITHTKIKPLFTPIQQVKVSAFVKSYLQPHIFREHFSAQKCRWALLIILFHSTLWLLEVIPGLVKCNIKISVSCLLLNLDYELLKRRNKVIVLDIFSVQRRASERQAYNMNLWNVEIII